MLVFGDPHLRIGFRDALANLEARCQGGVRTFDELRTLLVRAGQVEQGVADHAELVDCSCRSAVSCFLEGVADLFCRAFRTLLNPHDLTSLVRALRRPGGDLKRAELKLKRPEGFEFYSLYPEQYILVAERWSVDHQELLPGRVLVVGIRSIGTTLSAVVASSLKELGWSVHRITVRPQGPPSERTVVLPELGYGGFSAAIVVDEGPGQSGSSMASVSSALARSGLERIALFPSHEGMPGLAASPDTLRIWQTCSRYFVPLSKVRWAGRTLQELLVERTQRIAGVQPGALVDVGAGQWRTFAYGDARDWPAVCSFFDRPKLLCRLADTTAILWKFQGLGAFAQDFGDHSVAALDSVSTPAPLGTAAGFVATRWQEGARFCLGDQAPLHQLAAYIRASSSPWPENVSAADSLERLSNMLYWNTREAIGADAAEQARSAANDAIPFSLRAYTDGRMGPWEWVRLAGGALLKTDLDCHAADHTCVGVQPAAWDVAGAIVEWNLSDRSGDALRELSGPEICPNSPGLTFYTLAYAAFRLGICTFCADSARGDERARLDAAIALYRSRLERELSPNVAPARVGPALP